VNALSQQVEEKRQCEDVERQRHEAFGETLSWFLKPIVWYIGVGVAFRGCVG